MGKSAPLSLEEYKKLSAGLPFAAPFSKCCDQYLRTLHIEPLEGRNTLEVDRTCILHCTVCKKMFAGPWD